MTKYLIGIVIAVLLMFLGELMTNDTKKTYIEKGYNWNKVLIYSNLAAILGGLLSTLVVKLTGVPESLNPQFLPFATAITAYITAQSLMTDLKTMLINRKILRVGYISMYCLALYNVLTVEAFKINLMSLVLFTFSLIFIFVISAIGASDVRAIAVALPFVVSMGGNLAIWLLIISLLLASAIMHVIRGKLINEELERRRKSQPEMYKEVGAEIYNKATKKAIRDELNKSEKHAMPVGPFMILPFLIFLIIYPIIL